MDAVIAARYQRDTEFGLEWCEEVEAEPAEGSESAVETTLTVLGRGAAL